MNLAIKLYSKMPSDDKNVLAGINGNIPAEVRFNVNTPPDETYTIMTTEQYITYMNSIEAELQNWNILQEHII